MMKKIIYMLLVLVFAGCQGKEEEFPKNAGENEKTYRLGFEFGGELIEMDQEPMSKAEVVENRDLYWVDIMYSLVDKNQYEFYGRGVYDNPDSITVEFKEGYKYRISMTMIEDGKDKIWKDIVTKEYCRPLTAWYEKRVCDNKFVITTNQGGFTTTEKSCWMQGEGNTYWETWDQITGRYFSRIDDFIPQENGKIKMSMYKVSYGIRVKVKGLTSGTLNVSYPLNNDRATFSFDTKGEQVKEYPELQWLSDFNEMIRNINSQKRVVSERWFNVSWTSADGNVTLNLGDKSFWLERNKMNIVTVNLSQIPSVYGGADITLETTPMTDKDDNPVFEGSIE